jgi:hypothetical protein
MFGWCGAGVAGVVVWGPVDGVGGDFWLVGLWSDGTNVRHISRVGCVHPDTRGVAEAAPEISAWWVAIVVGVDRARLAGALASIVAAPPAVADLPQRLCMACLAALPVDGVGVSLMTRSNSERVLLGASDAIGARIEQLQFDLGEGPCVSAFQDAQPVLVPDLAAVQARARWPMFTHEAPAVGASAVFAFPLQVGAIGIGVFDCHRARAGPLAEVAEALVVADAVTMALLNLQARLAEDITSDVADLFDVTWRTHAVVHQATGAVAVQLRLSTEEALARLRAYAFRHARPLDAVATDVMANRVDLIHDEG